MRFKDIPAIDFVRSIPVDSFTASIEYLERIFKMRDLLSEDPMVALCCFELTL